MTVHLKTSPWKHLLVLIPVAAPLAVPLYNREQPVVLGFPCFYWSLIAFIAVTMLLLWARLRLLDKSGEE